PHRFEITSTQNEAANEWAKIRESVARPPDANKFGRRQHARAGFRGGWIVQALHRGALYKAALGRPFEERMSCAKGVIGLKGCIQERVRDGDQLPRLDFI